MNYVKNVSGTQILNDRGRYFIALLLLSAFPWMKQLCRGKVTFQGLFLIYIK